MKSYTAYTHLFNPFLYWLAVGASGLQHGAYAEEMGQPRICKPLGRRCNVHLLHAHLASVPHSSAVHVDVF